MGLGLCHILITFLLIPKVDNLGLPDKIPLGSLLKLSWICDVSLSSHISLDSEGRLSWFVWHCAI